MPVPIRYHDDDGHGAGWPANELFNESTVAAYNFW